MQVRRNGLLSFVPDEAVVCPRRVLPLSCRIASPPQRGTLVVFWIPHFCGMTATDCLACGRMSTLRSDDYRLPGFVPGCFSGFRISAELQVAVKAMTATDCLACGRMSTLRSDGCRLPGFTPGCCSGKTFLPLCVSASRCQVVIPRLTRYPGLQVLMSDCVGLQIRRNGESAATGQRVASC